MKITSYFLALISPLIFMSCNTDEYLISHELKNIEATIQLPNVYKTVKANDIERIISREGDSTFKNELLEFHVSNPEDELLVDTLNPYKFITISNIKPPVTIDTSFFYLIIDHERSISSSNSNVVDSTYYVGSKMGSVGKMKFIESKYLRQDSNGRKRIGYTFLISNEAKTIGIRFYNPEEENVFQYINSIKKR